MEKNTKTLEFKNLYYDVVNTDKKIKTKYARIIESLSGKFESGKLSAILGSSGCGKTHLLNMLLGQIESSSKTHGQLLYNGKEIDPESWKKKISYLPQDDVFYPDISVFDHLMFYASLGNSENCKEKDDHINNILESCCVLHKKHSLIGDLSGGERKRVMIAIAMISRPEILILDEPTTGLDSNTALEIIQTLKNYAVDTNSIVVCTVHQPGSGLFSFFDHIMILVKRGLFYSGPVNGLDSFFESNGMVKSETLSIPEFIFVILSKESNNVESIRYRNKIDEIVARNASENVNRITTLKCNNSKKVSWSTNFSDIRLMSDFFPKVYFGKPWSAGNLGKWALAILPYILGPILGFIFKKYLKLELADASEDYKSCSYYDLFILSWTFSFALNMPTIYSWNYLSVFGIFQDVKNFKAEYSIGRYTFGSYFLYAFLYVYIRIIMILFFQLPFHIFLFREFMLNPFVIAFSSLFILALAAVLTFTTLICNFSYKSIIFFVYSWKLMLNISTNTKSGDIVVIQNDILGYVLKLFPFYNFMTLFNASCSEFYRTKQHLSLKSLAEPLNFAGRLRLSLVDDMFARDGKHEILDSVWVMIGSFVGSCLLFTGLLYLLCWIYNINNMRTKYTKAN